MLPFGVCQRESSEVKHGKVGGDVMGKGAVWPRKGIYPKLHLGSVTLSFEFGLLICEAE